MANDTILSAEVKDSGAGPGEAAICIWNEPSKMGYIMIRFEGDEVVARTTHYLHRLIADAALALQELER